ncbi:MULTISPECIES: DUF6702 family protein [unclassified Tenacibaculum]|uniref:DUF6702 family protein n=1 Tax=unclassified Tenacibaculum TaxID=2635139 RepID=UPI001F1AFDF5|nr:MULTISPECIES: DUF6702 family protein [unclassified Tenacibaculum]MCF2876409.1 hypothetical protein [Tenacibaculum sp. Cn5-1]MCF2936448.1 hypothetical protein [Tenacibaculum sp. Cn5-34]MCG7512827.1 hypothetical protein [Tenacibaculum sp. Cn5-46]
MKKLFIVLLIVPLLSFSVHKYYIALTEIEYKEESQSVQMIMNVFMDDIETAINQDFNIDLQLSTKKELKNSDEYFLKYLRDHFKIHINDQNFDYNFIGKEYDGNIVYFYLEIENVSSVKSIEIHNDVLIKYFPDQQNLIKASIKKERKSLFLTKKNDKGLLKF